MTLVMSPLWACGGPRAPPPRQAGLLVVRPSYQRRCRAAPDRLPASRLHLAQRWPAGVLCRSVHPHKDCSICRSAWLSRTEPDLTWRSDIFIYTAQSLSCSVSEVDRYFLLPVRNPIRTRMACFHRSRAEPKRPPFEAVKPVVPTQPTQPSRTGRAAVRHLQSIAGSARRAGAPSRADVHGAEDTFPDSNAHAMYQSDDQRQQEEGLSDFEAEEARAVHDSTSRAQLERAASRPSSRPSSRRASLRAEDHEVRKCLENSPCTAAVHLVHLYLLASEMPTLTSHKTSWSQPEVHPVHPLRHDHKGEC